MLVEVLAPNTRRLYWKGYIDVRIETVHIAEDFGASKALLPNLIAGIARGVVKVAGYGLEVESVGVKDIILPSEMKLILAKVVEAEKAA